MATATQQKAAPTALRVIHAIVFVGFAAATVAGTHQELLQLWRALSAPYHSGTPPLAVACASGLLAIGAAVALLVRVALGRTVPLIVSGLTLLGFLGGLSVIGFEPRGRTVPGANVKSLEQAKVLYGRVHEPLQKTGAVPVSPETFALEGESPFYRRPFTPLPWRVEKVNRTDALPDGAEPGWLLFQASPDGASFVITCVGIDDEGAPSLLRQEGKPIEYRGAYNPDTAQ